MKDDDHRPVAATALHTESSVQPAAGVRGYGMAPEPARVPARAQAQSQALQVPAAPVDRHKRAIATAQLLNGARMSLPSCVGNDQAIAKMSEPTSDVRSTNVSMLRNNAAMPQPQPQPQPQPLEFEFRATAVSGLPSVAGAPKLISGVDPGQPCGESAAAESAAKTNPERSDLRIHVEFTAQGACIWLGLDRGRLNDLPDLVRLLEQSLRVRGIRLAALVCNGRPVPINHFLEGDHA
jgi:hypothetical protein